MTDNRKSWTIHQDQAIQSIVEQIGIKNWPIVSQLMKEKYQLADRSGKQCRQRWHNQLSPELNKRPWTELEEQQLFQAHRKHGNRWIQISKQFGGRTDNSIKNHFYSTIRRSMRRICKILGNRNSTSKLRNIRPSILSEIFQFSKNQAIKSHKIDDNIDVTCCLLQYAKQKPSKLVEFDPSSKDDLQRLVNRLIALNDQYVHFKSQKRFWQPKSKLAKKSARKNASFKLKGVKQELSQTNSSISHNEFFEKQHSSQIIASNILQNLIQVQDQKSTYLIRQDFQLIEDVSLGEEISIQSSQDNYLIIRNMPVHSMFDSTDNFNEIQHRKFNYLQNPSFQQIVDLNDHLTDNSTDHATQNN